MDLLEQAIVNPPTRASLSLMCPTVDFDVLPPTLFHALCIAIRQCPDFRFTATSILATIHGVDVLEFVFSNRDHVVESLALNLEAALHSLKNLRKYDHMQRTDVVPPGQLPDES